MLARYRTQGDETMTELADHSVFLVLFVTVFLDFLGFAMVLPYLYFYAESIWVQRCGSTAFC